MGPFVKFVIRGKVMSMSMDDVMLMPIVDGYMTVVKHNQVHGINIEIMFPECPEEQAKALSDIIDALKADADMPITMTVEI